MQISRATKHDLEDIVAIYNWAILNTTATFDLDEKTVEQKTPWFEQHGDRFSIFVGKEKGKNQITGWASITPWSDRKAYDQAGEVAIYIHPEFQGKGIGKILMQKLIDHAIEKNFRTLISKISCEAESSFKLHHHFGFEETGILKKVGFKFERVLDVHILQLFLE